MCSTATQVESWQAPGGVARVEGRGPGQVELVHGHGPVEDVASSQSKHSLQVWGCEDVPSNHQLLKTRGILLYTVKHYREGKSQVENELLLDS